MGESCVVQAYITREPLATLEVVMLLRNILQHLQQFQYGASFVKCAEGGGSSRFAGEEDAAFGERIAAAFRIRSIHRDIDDDLNVEYVKTKQLFTQAVSETTLIQEYFRCFTKWVLQVQYGIMEELGVGHGDDDGHGHMKALGVSMETRAPMTKAEKQCLLDIQTAMPSEATENTFAEVGKRLKNWVLQLTIEYYRTPSADMRAHLRPVLLKTPSAWLPRERFLDVLRSCPGYNGALLSGAGTTVCVVGDVGEAALYLLRSLLPLDIYDESVRSMFCDAVLM